MKLNELFEALSTQEMLGVNAGSGWCDECQCIHYQECDHGHHLDSGHSSGTTIDDKQNNDEGRMPDDYFDHDPSDISDWNCYGEYQDYLNVLRIL